MGSTTSPFSKGTLGPPLSMVSGFPGFEWTIEGAKYFPSPKKWFYEKAAWETSLTPQATNEAVVLEILPNRIFGMDLFQDG